MLFDLRGRRRRAVQGTYLMLALLMGGGLAWRPYVTRAYSVAAVLLIAGALVTGETFSGYSTETYAIFVALALVPQLIGHTSINRSLGYLPAATVAVAVLGEPVGATILGAIFLDETPTAVQLAGALFVLAGVYAGLRQTLSKQVIPTDSELTP